MSTRERYELLDALRSCSRPRTATCRRKRIASTVQAQRSFTPDGVAATGFQGIACCGSVWGCPVCSAKICAERAGEIQSAVSAWRGQGGEVSMLTLTVRHAIGNGLKQLRKGLARAYRRLFSGRAGARRKRDLRVVHSVRALEVTHGANGWHPHLHVLLFQKEPPLPGAEAELRAAWHAAVTAELGAGCAPSDERGVQLGRAHNTRYLAKLGLEVGGSQKKRGRGASRSVWQVADDAARGHAPSRMLWRTYVEDMLGARQLYWSRGARKALGLGKERADDELALDGQGELIVEWQGPEWDRLCRAFPRWVSMVAEAVASGTLAELPRIPDATAGPPTSIRERLRALARSA